MTAGEFRMLGALEVMTNYCSEATAHHAHDDANAGPDMPDLGFGALAHRDVLRAVCMSFAGGVADVATTSDVVSRLGSGRARRSSASQLEGRPEHAGGFRPTLACRGGCGARRPAAVG